MSELQRAELIARRAHAGQIDKNGQPYIEHPAAVASLLREAGYGERFQIVAWLHDVVEDCPDWDSARLEAAGISPQNVVSVEALTHRQHEPRIASYIPRVFADPVARVVKRFDMQHNTDPARLGQLAPDKAAALRRKYAENAAELDRLEGLECLS